MRTEQNSPAEPLPPMDLALRCQAVLHEALVKNEKPELFLPRAAILELIESDLEGYHTPEAWRKTLALAHHDPQSPHRPEPLTAQDLGELHQFAYAGGPLLAPTMGRKAEDPYAFAASAGSDEDRSYLPEAEDQTPDPPALRVVTSSDSAEGMSPAKRRGGTPIPWLALAAGVAVVAFVAFQWPFGEPKPSASVARLTAQLQQAQELLKEAAADRERLALAAEAKDKVFAEERQKLEAARATATARSAALENRVASLETKVKGLALPESLSTDLKSGFARAGRVASGGSEDLTPSYTAVLSARPSFSWKPSSFTSRISLFDLGARSPLWTSEPLPPGQAESVSGITLARGRYYQWTLSSSEPGQRAMRVPFYVLSGKEAAGVEMALGGQPNREQRAAVYRRFRLYGDLAALGGAEAQEAARLMKNLKIQ